MGWDGPGGWVEGGAGWGKVDGIGGRVMGLNDSCESAQYSCS